MQHTWPIVLTTAILLAASPTAAQEDEARERSYFGLSVEAFGAIPVDSENSDLFGGGVGGALDLELNIHPYLGVTAGFQGQRFWSDQSDEGTEWLGGRLGPRVHWGALLGAVHDDGWLDFHVALGSSGGIVRAGFDIGLGYAFTLIDGLRLGPFVRYQFGSDPQGDNAQILMAGVTVGVLGDPREAIAAPLTPPPPRPAPEVTPANPDMDGDGVLNEQDVCPATPQGALPDRDRLGCPATDTDSDGVLDIDDVCPMEPHGARPDPRNLGCPQRDQDGDEVIDREDQCPAVPQGATPDPGRRGCPQGDRDRDGVTDTDDVCPTTHAGPNPDPARAGCPLPDRDTDSVPDEPDACPDLPGAPSLDPSRNGCPGLVRVVGGQITINQPIFFEHGSNEIRAESLPVLGAVADALSALSVLRVRIEGHSDSTGPDDYNLDLSRQRSQAVLRWLVAHGVRPQGAEAIGRGETRPIAPNDTEEGRARNRRVEFRILDSRYQGSDGE